MELREFAEFLVKSIVKDPETVKVQEFGGEENTVILEIIVHSSDMGLVIGRGGKMANSIRTLIQAQAYLQGRNKVNINFDSY